MSPARFEDDIAAEHIPTPHHKERPSSRANLTPGPVSSSTSEGAGPSSALHERACCSQCHHFREVYSWLHGHRLCQTCTKGLVVIISEALN